MDSYGPQSLTLAGDLAMQPVDEIETVGENTDAHSDSELIGATPRLVDYALDQIRPHPSYNAHKLSVGASQLATLEDLGEMAFQYPIIVTKSRLIVDGYARWEFAKRRSRSTLSCLEYDLTNDAALHLLIQTHCRSHSLNDFRRIELALDLEPQFKEAALFNRHEGGRLKALSRLTKAERVHSRLKIARVAQVSVGNVHKVKCILQHACSALCDAARTSEISINLAEKWSRDPESKQQENLRLRRIACGIRRKARNLVAAHFAINGPSASKESVIRLADFLRLVQQLSVVAPEQSKTLGSIEVKLVPDPGRTLLVPEEILWFFTSCERGRSA